MKVAVSWSGGLESSLACHKVIQEGHDVSVEQQPTRVRVRERVRARIIDRSTVK